MILSKRIIPALLRFVLALFFGGWVSCIAMAQTASVTIGTASGLPGTSVNISVGFTPGATPVSALNFDLTYSSAISYSNVSAGQAALDAGKSVSGNAVSATTARILVFGINRTAMGSGAIANIQLNISASAPVGPQTLQVGGIAVSDPDGNLLPSSGTNGGVTVLAPADTTAPTITSVTATGITGTDATITWTTNEASNTQADYGTTTSYGSTTALNSSMVTSHSRGLTGLTSGTLYHYRVKSRDAAGNLATSGDYTFTTTTGQDNMPPEISGVASSNITTTGATISWTTDEAADTQVEYGLSTSYGSSTTLNAAFDTLHSQVLTGLTANSTYHYRVRSRDAAGNPAVSDDYIFKTTAVLDTTPPIISEVYSSNITVAAASIFWMTNELAGSQVEYGATAAYDSSTSLNSALAMSHSQRLTGLTAGTLYHYRVKSRDAEGNSSISADYTFTTARGGTPPMISFIVISDVTSRSATISWNTDKQSDSLVEYWITEEAVNKSGLGDPVTTHSLTLNNLQKSSQYYLRVKSSDAEGNEASSLVLTFNTQGSGAFLAALPRYGAMADRQGSEPGSSIMTGIALANTGTNSAALTFTAIDGAGSLIRGPGILNPGFGSLDAGTQQAILDPEVFGEGILASDTGGWIKLESSGADVGGFFLTFDSGLSLMDGAGFVYTPLKNFIFSEIEAAGSTKIDIANTGSLSANANFDLIRADGTIRSSQSRVINGNGALVADLFNDIFKGIEPDPADYVRVRSPEGVQPFQMMQKEAGDIASLTGQDVTAGGTTLYSPQYVIGGPWKTSLSIVNLEARPGMVMFMWIGEDGLPIGVARAAVIPANGKIRIDDPGYFVTVEPGTIRSGYVKIESDGIRLAGSTVFGDSAGESFSSALSMIYSLKDRVICSHVASNDQYFTGVAVLNPNAADATVTIDVFKADGSLIDRRIMGLPARQKRAQLLSEYFPSLVGMDYTSGYIRVTADKPIASFSLFGTNSLSVLSAIPPQ